MEYLKHLFTFVMIILIAAVSFSCSSSTPDFTVTSSVDNNHSHKIIISGTDVDKPPDTKIITSDGANHTHTIKLVKQDYQSIKAGQEITLVSSSDGPVPHTHTFKIKKP